MNNQTYIDIQLAELESKAAAMKAGGQRLVQICCTKLPDKLEINYSFDKDFAFTNLRVTLTDTSVKVPSITKSYLSAFHYENEIHDLFGVQVEGNAVDYKGNFYRTAVKAAFNPPAPAASGDKS